MKLLVSSPRAIRLLISWAPAIRDRRRAPGTARRKLRS